jgi:hypothetical protein
MGRGIQKNTTVWDNDSKILDENCRKARNILIHELHSIKYLECKLKLPKNIIPGGEGSCAPDGGAWFYKDIFICTFEAKKQQNAGNAIERWFKNNFICRTINPNISYITFASGMGARLGGVIQKTLNVAHFDGGIDTYIPTKNSIFYSIDGFTLNKMIDIMRSVIMERINHEG